MKGANPLKSKGMSERNFLKSYRPTSVVTQLKQSVLSRIRRGKDVIPAIDGRQETKDDVIRVILSGANLYLISEEGTGKTRMAKAISGLLPPIPVIKGSPYNDDPKWPPHLLSPWSQTSANPVKEFGIEWLPGTKRFSRVQGNEYTNEAKLLGLKDIQAIAQGKSPSDPSVFTGTGVFRANRGVLLIDELPAIRTRVQVLLHPILEEKKAMLEEYQWEWPLDIFVVATGNPQGFSHVNDVPRPLMDRLETVYMDLPDEKTEKEIMLKERFREPSGGSDYSLLPELLDTGPEDCTDYVDEETLTPWWIVEVINKTVRLTRVCPKLDKKATIRATSRAFDHTRSTVEMNLRQIATLADAFHGLKLALRGRVGLQPDAVDFDNPRENCNTIDRITEDLISLAIEDLTREYLGRIDLNREDRELKAEIEGLIDRKYPESFKGLAAYPRISRLVGRLKRIAPESTNLGLLSEKERILFRDPESLDKIVSDEYDRSAIELVVNMAVSLGLLPDKKARSSVFVPKKLDN
ncbi:MAG: AAA domain-containing protein [Proteobacteria bacterium]|nr:AAA domain-containing protein [Pseudomonadota bacterium]